MTKTFCPIPWNHLAIQQNGNLRQCCQMTDAPFGHFMDGDQALRFDADNIDTIRNHHSIKNIRSAMLKGQRPTACNLCWTEEDSGIVSKRMSMNEIYPADQYLAATKSDGTIDITASPLAYLDLRLGNLCNLKCRSCGPTDSSLWVEDHGNLLSEQDSPTFNFYGANTYKIQKNGSSWKIDSDDFNWHQSGEFHEWLNGQIVKNVTRIYFTGGEPTVNKYHVQILEEIIALGKSHSITLEYNSNMVAIPQSLLKLWKNFYAVHIGASIDAIGSLASYIRHPGRWPDVEKNCDSIGYGQIPQISCGIATTVSVMNIRHFIDLTKWAISKQFTSIRSIPSWHVLHGPKYFSIQVLPKEIKSSIEQEYHQFYNWVSENFGENDRKNIEQYYSGIIRFMWQEDLTKYLPQLKKTLHKVDKLRGENLADQIPWLDEILEQV